MLIYDRNMTTTKDQKGNTHTHTQKHIRFWGFLMEKKQYGEHLLEFCVPLVCFSVYVYVFLSFDSLVSSVCWICVSLWSMCVRNNDFTVVICTTERESVWVVKNVRATAKNNKLFSWFNFCAFDFLISTISFNLLLVFFFTNFNKQLFHILSFFFSH